VKRRWRILNGWVAAYYLLGTLALAAMSLTRRPWTLLLLWPALSTAIIAAAYLGVGARIYGKRDGKLAPWARLLLWPVLAGHVVSRWHYRRRSLPYDALTDRAWIGARLSDTEARRVIDNGVTAVMDLAAESSEAAPLRQVAYLQLSVLDLTAPTMDDLARAVAFIDEHIDRGVVYVHCKAGYSRTAAVAGAWLIATGRATDASQAIALMTAARRGMTVRPEVVSALEQFATLVRE
jgi:protein-tyrosine phosphatase